MADSQLTPPPLYRRAAWRLLAVTLLGGALRCWRLGQQSAWMDEAITGYRLAGSYHDLIHSLGNQGFGPAWYTLLYAFKTVAAWCVGDDAAVFRPGLLRVMPAAVGTLVVPAVYLLAKEFRGLAGPRWAMLAAGLAAVNPYAVYYARDLKMYSLLLLLFTLQTAGLLRFLRTRRTVDFAWAAVPLVLITATHLIAFWLLLIHALFLILPQHRRWRAAASVGAMWLLACVGPAVWYVVGTNVFERFASNKNSVGISWIGSVYTLDANLIAETPAMFLTGLGIPKTPPSPALQEYFQLGPFVTVNPSLANGIRCALLSIAVVFVVGQVPWRRWLRATATSDAHPSPLAPPWVLWVWAALPAALLALMSLPPGHAFSIYPHYMMFQPRFLIVCWPAVLLLLVAAIRNLPSWKFIPLRRLCAASVGSIMLASSLLNPFAYVVVPHTRMFEMAKPFMADGGRSVVLIASRSDGPDLEPAYASDVTLGHRPQFDLPYIQHWFRRANAASPYYPARLRDTPDEWLNRIRAAARSSTKKTLITFDRLGDTPLLDDAEILAALGSGWSKRQEVDDTLFTQWHPYLSFRYRCRLWQRDEPLTARQNDASNPVEPRLYLHRYDRRSRPAGRRAGECADGHRPSPRS